MKDQRENDFRDLDKILNKGAFVMMLLFSLIVFLSYWVYGLSTQNKSLEKGLTKSEMLLTKSRETSYNRFIYAKDLSEICDRFKSSREAKMKYYFENGIVE